MISNVSVKGLKSIDDLKVNFKNITLLVGTNSSGKSTLLQSILLASQNLENLETPLNGKLVSLGNFREVRNFITNSQEILIEIGFDNFNYKLDIVESDTNKEDQSKINRNFDSNMELIKKEICIDQGLYYLSSSRIGHKDIYDKNFSKSYKFGLLGEYCLHYFENNKMELLDEEIIKDTSSKTLQSQVNYWLKYIVGSSLVTEDIQGTDKIKASYGVNNRSIRTKNLGTGVSYLVSIIIMSLSINRGETIIIENPEIHLHPKAQSLLTEFLIFISLSGRQVIIETHSDHIFNGLRVAIAKEQIQKEDYMINFFALNSKGCTEVTEVEVSKRGRICGDVENLFDQFEIDLDKMIGLI